MINHLGRFPVLGWHFGPGNAKGPATTLVPADEKSGADKGQKSTGRERTAGRLAPVGEKSIYSSQHPPAAPRSKINLPSRRKGLE